MIIDEILDVRDGFKQTPDLKYMYDEATLFRFNDLARALDCGSNKDIQKALCDYIIDCEYNPEICEFINTFDWLKGVD